MQYKLKYPLVIGLLISPLLTLAAPPKNRISMNEARAKVAEVQPGQIKGQELEHENGKWIYSFDVLGNDQQIHEVHVDAKTGRVVSQTVESAAHEASEARNEAD